MAGPWEAYQPQSSGPWSAYQPAKSSAPAEPAYNAAEDTPAYERPMINIGAGLQSLVDAVQQMRGNGPNDAEVKDKRARDAQLAAADPVVGKAYQLLGQSLPFLAAPAALPEAGAAALARVVGPAAARVLGTMGVGAGVGAASGAAEPVTSNESRGLNTAVGAAAGAAVPGAFAAAGPAAKMVRDTLTTSGAANKAGFKLADLLKPEDLDALRAYVASNPSIPHTAAEITQSPALAVAERQANLRDPAGAAEFVRAQQAARQGIVDDALSGANQLDAAKAARDAATGPMREQAFAAAGKASDEGGPGWLAQPIQDATDSILAKYPKSSPSYKVAQLVSGDLADASPLSLYETRKVLTSKLNGPTQIGDDVSAAVKGARKTTMDLVKTIDSSLDSATDGAWSKYLSEYSSKSGEVNSAEAKQLIQGALDQQGNAGNPLTANRLSRVIREHGSNDYGNKLDSDAAQQLETVMDSLRQSEGIQKLVKGAGTSGGGSNTAMDLASGEVENRLTNMIPFVAKMIKRSDNLTQAAMADALRNPQLFISAVSKAQKSGQPLSPTQDAILRVLRAAGSSTPALLAPQ